MSNRQVFDIAVIGAGPAGIAAACCAAESGKSVALLDDNPNPGGQIWRGAGTSRPAKGIVHKWLSRLEKSKVVRYNSTQVLDATKNGVINAQSYSKPIDFQVSKTILACGMRERFIPFPGWTLPQVVGVGGIQALVKGGMSIKDKKVLIAGSGPLLLAVADDLNSRGAKLVGLAEQASFKKTMNLGLGLWRFPRKALQGIGIFYRLRKLNTFYQAYPARVKPSSNDKISVSLVHGKRNIELEADFLACGFGLVPNLELPAILGCRISGNKIERDEYTETTVPGVFAPALTSAGNGGVDQSLIEGQIAGYAASGELDSAHQFISKSRHIHKFSSSLDRTYKLSKELNEIIDDDTIVCRCEDVKHKTLKCLSGWKHAKLQSRCGMGPCQGRVCGPAINQIYGWPISSVRPPVFPATIGTLFPKAVEHNNNRDA